MGCHLNTCPVGVTSQKEALRKKFPGTPEHVVNFFEFVAEELRELMAHLGYSKFEDLIGRADLLKEDEDQFSKVAKTKGISLSGFFSSIPDSKEERAFLRATPAEVADTRMMSFTLMDLAQTWIVRFATIRMSRLPLRTMTAVHVPCWLEILHANTETRALMEV